ncbi:hypothetical protein [Thioclava sediminum]|uniref:hypothetical protein n=1 Tax=Thioclava sediminum TaxID=1915319 RepID=UPI001314CA6E|nr:hypothetical protein [Thioclava sediminum]
MTTTTTTGLPMTAHFDGVEIAAIRLSAQLKEEVERGLETPEKRERCRRLSDEITALLE